MKSASLLALFFLMSGCAAGEGSLAHKANTLVGNEKLPSRDIEKISDPVVWDRICDMEYAGYVILEGQIEGARQVRIRKLVKKYPDDSRDRLAVALGNNVVMKSIVGASGIPPRALVYVVFYEKLRDGGNLALVFAKQLEFSNQGKVDSTYLNTVKY